MIILAPSSTVLLMKTGIEYLQSMSYLCKTRPIVYGREGKILYVR